jgi:hypothetical protein
MLEGSYLYMLERSYLNMFEGRLFAVPATYTCWKGTTLQKSTYMHQRRRFESRSPKGAEVYVDALGAVLQQLVLALHSWQI